MKKQNRSVTLCSRVPSPLKKLSTLVVGLLSLGMLDAFEERAYGAPSGGVVQQGQAFIEPPKMQNGVNYQQITQQSQKAVINWQKFNVGQQEHVHFQLPDAKAATLNRVVGQDLSTIAGKLSSTGQLFLVNPNGVMFAQGAQVDAAGIVASTMQISDQDFMQGNYQFNPLANVQTAGIINQGTLTAHEQGTVALLSAQVSNQGVISAKLGKVALAAGDSQATLDFYGDELIRFAVDKSTQAYNLEGQPINVNVDQAGRINADGGQVVVTTHTVSNVLSHSINMSGVIQAQAIYDRGGEVILAAGDYGQATISGQIDVTGNDQADGGKVDITGHSITLTDSAHLDASGRAGGEINIFAEDTTTVAGTLHAKGTTGKGGFIETSGKRVVEFNNPTVDASSLQGENGEWLIDPINIVVDASNVQGFINTLNSGTNVTLDSTVLGSEAGNITIEADMEWDAGSKLIIKSLRDVTISSSIQANEGGLEITAGIGSESGMINVTGNIAVDRFSLHKGTWSQVVGESGLTALPSFSAEGNFQLDAANSTFKRFAGGDGASADTAYQLTDIYGLQGVDTIVDQTAGVYFKLDNDINAGITQNWQGDAFNGFNPIGSNTQAFLGQFDGNSKTIYNLNLSNQPGQKVSSNVGLFAIIGENAVVENLKLKGLSLEGYNATNDYGLGGLAGVNYGTITKVEMVGQLVGTSVDDPDGDYDNDTSINLGGVVGINQGVVEQSFAQVDMVTTTTGFDVGGLVGDNNGRISLSGTHGTLSSESQGTTMGGLVGYNTGEVEKSFSSVDVSGFFAVASLVGETRNGSITQSYATGSVLGAGSVGGLVGYAHGNSSITDSFATGDVESIPTANKSDFWSVGGLVGTQGNVDPERDFVVIENSFALGTVTLNSTATNSYAGGLVGAKVDGSIAYSYAAGAVSGTGSARVGGLIGAYRNQADITSSYWNTETTGRSTSSGGGVGLTTAQMMDRDNFTGWDFENTWDSLPGKSYPFLKIAPYIASPNAMTLSESEIGRINQYLGDADTLNVALNSGITGSNNSVDLNVAAAGFEWSEDTQLTLMAKDQVLLPSEIYGAEGGLVLHAGEQSKIGFAQDGTVVSVNDFTLQQGIWEQIGSSADGLTAFNVSNNFQLVNETSVFSRFFGGDGASADSAYQIADIYGLQGLATHAGKDGFEGTYYQLNNALDMSSAYNWQNATRSGFTPIGEEGGHFNGHVNGQENVIHNLVINERGDIDNVGLFGYLGADGSLKNIGIENGYVVSGGDQVGGLVGLAQGYVENSYFHGTVAGDEAVGGLVGSLSSGEIQQGYAQGHVTGDTFVGGLVGYAMGDIQTSGAHVTVEGEDGVGGLAGGVIGNVQHSFATGRVTGQEAVGGLIGDLLGEVTQSFATGGVEGELLVGGLVGDLEGDVTNSFATGAVQGTDRVGGLAGRVSSAGEVNNSYSIGLVQGEQNVGGLIGQLDEGTVTASYWNTETSGQASSAAGTGKTTAELQQQDTFTGWVFDNENWALQEGVYPYLMEVTPSPQIIQGALTQSGEQVAGEVIVLNTGDAQYLAASGADGAYYHFLPNTEAFEGIEANDVVNVYVEDATVKSNMLFKAGTTAPTASINTDLEAGWVYLKSDGTLTNSIINEGLSSIPEAHRVKGLNLDNSNTLAANDAYVDATGSYALNVNISNELVLNGQKGANLTGQAGSVQLAQGAQGVFTLNGRVLNVQSNEQAVDETSPDNVATELAESTPSVKTNTEDGGPSINLSIDEGGQEVSLDSSGGGSVNSGGEIQGTSDSNLSGIVVEDDGSSDIETPASDAFAAGTQEGSNEAVQVETSEEPSVSPAGETVSEGDSSGSEVQGGEQPGSSEADADADASPDESVSAGNDEESPSAVDDGSSEGEVDTEGNGSDEEGTADEDEKKEKKEGDTSS